MQIEFNYAKQHHCSAGLLCCQDFRFQQAIRMFVTKKLQINDYDSINIAGGAKAILECDLQNDQDIITKSIDVTYNLHPVSYTHLTLPTN